MIRDPHSFSRPQEARVTHLQWYAMIDFTAKIISAKAIWEIETKPEASEVILDIKGLAIKSIMVDERNAANFALGAYDELLGQSLAISIEKDTKTVTIEYETTKAAEALQWLAAAQTAEKIAPFLFTQSQAILARTWIPCQDSPQLRFTYEAEVTVPEDILPLMSASNPQDKNKTGTYTFKMEQPIPSYLLALVAGNIKFHPVSERCGIYAEPSFLASAVWEFTDLEKMVSAAEELYGQYRWDRYDVIVLPPSFPFGGMENPRLTFATPTILSGDRSLVSLIAHELAHSWSGNLVTNATWNDFWLNEGFTVYFEHRIMEKLYGRDYSEMLASLALHDLKMTIESLTRDNGGADTKLKLNLEGRNPDDGVTDIAYNKGYFFLRRIEELHGRENFDVFLKEYFAANAFQAMDTDRFIKFIRDFYRTSVGVSLEQKLFDDWIFSEGLPTDHPVPAPERLANVDRFLHEWLTTKRLDDSAKTGWTTHEWLHFLKGLPKDLSPEQLTALDSLGSFTASENAEIETVWLGIAIHNRYEKAYPKLEKFLINTGRRKFLSPLYEELVKSADGKLYAKKIYEKARPNYHFVATNTFDKLLT